MSVFFTGGVLDEHASADDVYALAGLTRSLPKKELQFFHKTYTPPAHLLLTSYMSLLCSADGPTHTESNKLYRKVKHRYRLRAYGATRLYTHSHELPALTALAQHISHSHSGIDEKRPTEKFVSDYRPSMSISYLQAESWTSMRALTTSIIKGKRKRIACEVQPLTELKVLCVPK